ncbi:hypothetical protein GA0115259_103408 [Streptomyces sp. MnatMP-M17]|nr:hypothetical protein GA0115259_103408 [Streptomyces sp. MnatMP-M17]
MIGECPIPQHPCSDRNPRIRRAVDTTRNARSEAALTHQAGRTSCAQQRHSEHRNTPSQQGAGTTSPCIRLLSQCSFSASTPFDTDQIQYLEPVALTAPCLRLNEELEPQRNKDFHVIRPLPPADAPSPPLAVTGCNWCCHDDGPGTYRMRGPERHENCIGASGSGVHAEGQHLHAEVGQAADKPASVTSRPLLAVGVQAQTGREGHQPHPAHPVRAHQFKGHERRCPDGGLDEQDRQL